MTRPAWWLVQVLGLTVALLAPAQAEVVRLRVGSGVFGQGWMFLDNDGHCKIVTAAHVVTSPDGRVLPTLVLTPSRLEMTPVMLHRLPGIDISTMSVPMADSPAVCGTGRLSPIGLERRLREFEHVTVLRTERSEVVQVPVERRAWHIDPGRGEIFAVHPMLSDDQVVEGWSGSVVVDDFGPIGIVIEANGANEAYAVRVDVIRRLMAAEPPSPGGDRAVNPSVYAIAGQTLDIGSGPDLVNAAGDRGWNVVPTQRTVVFAATFPEARQVRSARLRIAEGSAGAIDEIAVASSADPGGMLVDVNRCKARGDGRALECEFAPRTIRMLRFVVKTRSDGPVRLNGLTID